MEESGSGAPAFEVVGLRKHFGATVALDDVSLAVRPGDVHALLGENGAGKSTLVKILSGLIRPDAGEISLFGESARLGGPRAAHRGGIQTAYQEISLIKDLTVTQNMLLPYEPARLLWQVRRRRSEELVREMFRDMGLDDIDPRVEVSTLDLSTQQRIEIARAVSREPRILLLDEPTSALSAKDVEWLQGLIEGLRQAGVTTVFISHRMQEVRRLCDNLTVLRNGANVGSFAVADISEEEVIALVIGRSLAATFPEKPARTEDEATIPVLSAEGLAAAGRLKDISLELRPGDVLGIAGLEGMGQRELFLTLFGMITPTAGTMSVYGKPVALKSPRDALRADIGISLVPEERKTEALALEMTGRENVSLPVIDRFRRFGMIDTAAESAAVSRVLDLVQVDRRALHTACRVFSGGNQQKIVIAKWLLTENRILLMYDPTRGVDVGTKAEIYVMIRAYASAGGAVLFYSTDVPELVNLCDEVKVVYRGREAATLSGEALSEAAVMRAALGEGESS